MVIYLLYSFHLRLSRCFSSFGAIRAVDDDDAAVAFDGVPEKSNKCSGCLGEGAGGEQTVERMFAPNIYGVVGSTAKNVCISQADIRARLCGPFACIAGTSGRFCIERQSHPNRLLTAATFELPKTPRRQPLIPQNWYHSNRYSAIKYPQQQQQQRRKRLFLFSVSIHFICLSNQSPRTPLDEWLVSLHAWAKARTPHINESSGKKERRIIPAETKSRIRQLNQLECGELAKGSGDGVTRVCVSA